MLNQKLLEFFREQTRQKLEDASIEQLTTEISEKLDELTDSDFYTKRERKANEAEDKTKLIEGVLFEEFTIQ